MLTAGTHIVLTAFLGVIPAEVSHVEEGPPMVDLCELFRHPPEFRGRIVRVNGVARSGFEYFALTADCDEVITRESTFDRTCLRMSGHHPTSIVSATSESSSEDIVAMAEVTESVFLKKVLNEGYDAAVNSLPWQEVEYEVAEPHRDEIWQRFVDAIRDGNPRQVTLIGRFEFVNRSTMVRFRDGDSRIGRINGYGHMGACRSQLTVTRVVSVRDAEK